MSSGDVDVWTAALDWEDPDTQGFRAVLDSDELEQAGRLHSVVSRRRFIAKHAIRRLLIAEYLRTRPQQVAFTTNVAGKPRIENAGQLRFNDSSSAALAVYALANDAELGIDIEAVRAVPDAWDVVARFGSATERVAFQQIAPADRELAFLRWWTAKEAFVKANGAGLRDGLDGFSVSFPPDPAVSSFQFVEFSPADGYIGTLVSIGKPVQLRLRRWSPSRSSVAGGAA